MRGWWRALLLASPLALSAQTLLDFSPQETAQILAHGPWPEPDSIDASNRVQASAAAWGHELFNEPWLSRDGTLACATCHVPSRAFQDGRATAVSRHGTGTRNTPSLLDAAGKRWFGWGGATDSLWAASLAPLLNPAEMAQDVSTLAGRVRSLPALATGYRRSFGQAPPADDERVVVDVAKALAAFQATLVSPRTPFDAFRDALARGDKQAAALYPAAAQRGLRLFIGHGRCTICHAGPAFSSGEFADIGIPFFVPGGVDAGRHAGLQQLLASRFNRLGPHNDGGVADTRAVATKHVLIEHRHFGEFRVPSLRHLAHTAPYMHNGSVATLGDVVRHYSELNEERLHADGERILRRLNLSARDAADLEAFLRSLSR